MKWKSKSFSVYLLQDGHAINVKIKDQTLEKDFSWFAGESRIYLLKILRQFIKGFIRDIHSKENIGTYFQQLYN